MWLCSRACVVNAMVSYPIAVGVQRVLHASSSSFRRPDMDEAPRGWEQQAFLIQVIFRFGPNRATRLQ